MILMLTISMVPHTLVASITTRTPTSHLHARGDKAVTRKVDMGARRTPQKIREQVTRDTGAGTEDKAMKGMGAVADSITSTKAFLS